MSKSANRKLAAEVSQVKEEKVEEELKVEVNPPKPSDDDSAVIRCLERLTTISDNQAKRLTNIDARLAALEEICVNKRLDEEPEPQDSPAPQWPDVDNQRAQPVELPEAEPVLRYAYWDRKAGKYAYWDSKRNLLDAKRIGGGDWDRCWCWSRGGKFIPLTPDEMKEFVR